LVVQSVAASLGTEPSVGVTEPSLPGLVVEPSAPVWPSAPPAASPVLDPPGEKLSKSLAQAIVTEAAASIESARPRARLLRKMCISRTLLGDRRPTGQP
jgi:hypothetical protein